MTTILLTDGTTPIELSPDLLWVDEDSWSPVLQAVDPSITGDLIVHVQSLTTGREITLQPEDDKSGAMLTPIVDQVKLWAKVPGQQLTLTLRGVAHTVIFRHHDKPAFDAKPWIHYRERDVEDHWFCTLKFMEIS